jgi:integrase
MSSRYYQEGSLERVTRAKGPSVWVYRWRDQNRVQRKKVLGNVNRFKTKAEAKREVENFRAQINSELQKIARMTLGEAWGHFQEHELRVNRSPTTIDSYLDYFQAQILPMWKDVALEDVKAVAVEKWLRGLDDLAPGSKAKIRNHMSALFSHLIRHELYTKLNPIASVRQSAVRQRDPDILTLEEMRGILENIEPLAIRVMVAVAAASALRRSEMRGLKWEDLDFEARWINLRRGMVRKHETKMKTKASRKGVPMAPELAELLLRWREETPYPSDTAWVFASPFTHGKRPYWPDSALVDHIRPAATKAGIDKEIGWHTFRHSFATLMGQRGEGVKVVQELLRHASSRITQDIYQQGSALAKRTALGHISGVFAVTPTG